MSAKESLTKEELDKLFEDARNEVAPKLDFLKSTDDYRASEAQDALASVADLCSQIGLRKSKPQICSRVVDFFLAQGLVKLVNKVLKSLTSHDDVDAYQSRNSTHSIANRLISSTESKSRQLVRMELVKSGTVYVLLQDLQTCDPKTNDPRQTIRILRDMFILLELVLLNNFNPIPIYRGADAVNIVMKFTEASYEMNKVRSLMLLARIVNEEESHRLTSGTCVTAIVDMLEQAVDAEDLFYRYSIKIDDDNTMNLNLSVFQFAKGLNDLLSNDANKTAVVRCGGVPKLMSVFQPRPNAKKAMSISAKQQAVEALWKLALMDGTREVVVTHLNIDTVILEELKKLKSSANSHLRDASIGLLYQLEEIDLHDEQPPEEETKAESSAVGSDDDSDDSQPSSPPSQSSSEQPSYGESTTGMHIMISYNWDHQERVIKIRDKLKEKGHSVWMDIDKMRGNILKAMADGVEKADVMLMCFSRKYKGSACCQAEANYAFKLRKPIIPMKMESDYDADGWLGIVAGMDLYINAHSDNAMEKNFPLLIKELENVGR